MNWHNVGIVFRKEMVDSLRDRRTLISMVVVPIVLMPLITFGVGAIQIRIVGRAMQEVHKVMLIGGGQSPRVREGLKAIQALEVIPASADYARQIVEKNIRAAVEVPDDFDAALVRGDTATVKIYYFEGDFKSGVGVQNVQRFFQELRERTLQERLAARSLPANLLNPFIVKPANVAPPEKVSGAALGGVIAYMIIMFCLSGAMYPAIDLTAGEKERGTIETILSCPVARRDLVLGKFFTVLTASLVTAALSFGSMAATFSLVRAMKTGTGAQIAALIPMRFSTGGILASVLMILPVAVLFSALLLAVALIAKSYKEAQSYLTPLLLVAVLPAMFALLPGVELNAKLALVPVLNTGLISKEIVTGEYHWGYIVTIFLSSCVYAAISLWAAVRMFEREDVLFRA